MEGSGMRWKLQGADAVLKCRALDLTGLWDRFWRYHMAQEGQRRFGQRSRVPDPLGTAAATT